MMNDWVTGTLATGFTLDLTRIHRLSNCSVLLGKLFRLIFPVVILLKNRKGTGAIIAFKSRGLEKYHLGSTAVTGYVVYSHIRSTCCTGWCKNENLYTGMGGFPLFQYHFFFLFLNRLTSPRTVRRRWVRQGPWSKLLFLSCSPESSGYTILPRYTLAQILGVSFLLHILSQSPLSDFLGDSQAIR